MLLKEFTFTVYIYLPYLNFRWCLLGVSEMLVDMTTSTREEIAFKYGSDWDALSLLIKTSLHV